MSKSLLTCLAVALLSASALDAETKTFTDDFNRTDTNGAAGGGLGINWTVPATVYVNSNVAKTATAAEQLAIYNAISLSDSLSISANFYSQSNGRYAGLIFNYTDASNYSLLRFNFHATDATQWQFIERTAGTSTVVDSGSFKTGDTPLTTWRKISIVSTSTAGQYTFAITDSAGATTYATKTLTSQTTTLTGNAGLYFGSSNLWADNFSLTTNVSNIPEPSTVALLLGAAGLAGTLICRKCAAARR